MQNKGSFKVSFVLTATVAVRRHFDPRHSKLFPDLTSTREYFTAGDHWRTGCSGEYTDWDLCTRSDELPGYLGRQKRTLIWDRNLSVGLATRISVSCS